jgi:hypothetical protein
MNKNNLMAIKKKVTLHEKTRRERGKKKKRYYKYIRVSMIILPLFSKKY